MDGNSNYTVISADCHAGADAADYREYLDARWRNDFDAWLGSYEFPFFDLLTGEAERNWNSERRLAELEADGVVAEVLYPNTIPPFFSMLPPTAEDAAPRWAGLQAHNRWLADFCAHAPDRRRGLAQLLLHDVAASVDEVEWAAETPGIAGVLLPTALINDPYIEPLYSDAYDPLWAACERTGMILHTHGGIMSAAWGVGRYRAAGAVYIRETAWVTRRAMSHLILAGVFERFPGLRFVAAEQGSGWVPDELDELDKLVTAMRTAKPDSPLDLYGAPTVAVLEREPSEYFRRNCALGASFMRRHEALRRHEIGLEQIMWGADYPHQEGTTPHTTAALRWTFAQMPEQEVEAMVGGNAARLYGFDLDVLDRIAQRVGPSRAAVAEPIEGRPAGSSSHAFSG